MATLLLLLPVKPEIADLSVASTWTESLELVSRQHGFQRWCWGFQVKTPDVLQLFVDWDSVESYHNFKETGSFGPFTDGVQSVARGEVQTYLAKLAPHPAPGFDAPATEVVLINNPHDDFEVSLAEFSKFLVRNPGAIGRYSPGEIIEGSKLARRLYLVVGWESVEAQKAMMASPEFKDKVGLVRDHCETLQLDYVKLKRS